MNIDSLVFFTIDHYKNYPLMLINLATVCDKDLKSLLLAAWEIRAPERLKKEMDK